MSLQLRLVKNDEMDRLATTRWLCYGHGAKDLERFRVESREDDPGEYLLAERDGTPVGTATALPVIMWVRGAAVPCQAVAWVGTVKTERRRSGGGNVASAIMNEMLAMARRREQVISALLPFRASFYSHFGYGVMERRVAWTIPLSVLHSGANDGWRVFQPNDLTSLAALRQLNVENGQCDMERYPQTWGNFTRQESEGFLYVRDAGKDRPASAWAYVVHQSSGGKDLLTLRDFGVDSFQSFSSILSLLASLRDQYYSVVITVPIDWPLNQLFKEMQLPHRPVNHPTAETRMFTRMQSRIIDHKRFIEVLHLPPTARGSVTVAVHETEGQVSRFGIELDSGRATVKPADSAVFECPDRIWAAIVCGDLPASTAVRMNLATQQKAGAAELLDTFSVGPAPFCNEHF